MTRLSSPAIAPSHTHTCAWPPRAPSAPPLTAGNRLAPLLPLFPPALREAIAPGGAPLIPSTEQILLPREGFPSLFGQGERRFLASPCSPGEFDAVLRALLRGALYAHEQTLREGYLLYPGGYRVGVGGRARAKDRTVLSLSEIGFLVFRIPGRHPGVASPLRDLFLHLQRTSPPQFAGQNPPAGGEGAGHGFFADKAPEKKDRAPFAHPGKNTAEGPFPSGAPAAHGCGMLLYAPPGVGKTTVLRDLAEQLSGPPWSLHTVVADGREELFFGQCAPSLPGGQRHALSVLPGWPKAAGIEAALRCMSPELLLCDEIGAQEADAILEGGHGGLPLIAAAHGCSVEELYKRPSLRRLLTAGLFRCLVGLSRDAAGGMRFHCTPVQAVQPEAGEPGARSENITGDRERGAQGPREAVV